MANIYTSHIANMYISHRLDHGTDTAIRLLRLVHVPASQQNFHISCTLHVVDLKSAPEYTALSYAWGDKSDTRTIILEGQPFTVRRNLWDFLKQHRSTGAEGNLWIDAICIDQSSVLERNHQVAIMGRIYSQAQQVIAWLGATPERFVQAIEALSGLLPLANTQEHSISYLETIASCNYWNRAWIIQELLLSKNLVIRCGAASITGEDFQYALLPSVDRVYDEDESMMKELHGTHMFYIFGFRRLRAQSTARIWGSATLLTKIPRTECHYPKDRVYSLLSLIDPLELEQYPIVPDYTISDSQLFLNLCIRELTMNTERRLWRARMIITSYRTLLDMDAFDENVRKVDDWLEKFAEKPSLWGRFQLVMTQRIHTLQQ